MKKIVIIFLLINWVYSISAPLDSVAIRIEFNSNKFKYILETIYNNYADSVDIDKISEQAFHKLLNSLDKNSLYLTKDMLYKKTITDEGSEIGIGIDVRSFNDTIFVYTIIDNSPAFNSGLRPFDRIISINNDSVKGLTIEDIQQKLQGTINTVVSIEYISIADNKIRNIQINRTKIQVPSLNTSLMIPNNDIGYLNFKRFSKISHTELDSELSRLKKLGMKSLIIDLRDNPGGFLDEAGTLINEFLSGKQTITYTQSRNPQYRYHINSNDSGNYKKLPLIILVNDNSASACELFAAVMQDLDRGLVVGRKTFGKSSAQLLWKMTDSTGFQMTVAEYLTPLGRKISKISDNDKVLDESMKLNLNEQTLSQLNQMIDNYGLVSRIPIFTSKKGRSILGGAGVFPDYFVENEKQTLLTDVLIQKNIIIEYIYSFLVNNYNQINKDYGKSLSKFSKDFIVSDLMLMDLKKHSYTKNTWNEEMFQTDKQRIKELVKAEIARALFGDLGYYSIKIKNDKYVSRAIELMPESELFIK